MLRIRIGIIRGLVSLSFRRGQALFRLHLPILFHTIQQEMVEPISCLVHILITLISLQQRPSGRWQSVPVVHGMVPECLPGSRGVPTPASDTVGNRIGLHVPPPLPVLFHVIVTPAQLGLGACCCLFFFR